MKGAIALIAAIGLIGGAAGGAFDDLCQGFLPENDLEISVGLQIFQGGGVTEEEFHLALDRIDTHYGPIIEELGGRLKINREWDDDTVNASAQRFGSSYIINMYGGLARHPEMDADGFLLVACHEIGHHLGGAPKRGWFISWATNEGQADYFAGLRCLREIWTAEENAEFVKNNEIDKHLVESCTAAWEQVEEQDLCIRIAMAGMTTSALFKELKDEEHEPHYSTPDSNKVRRTFHSHPETQCRLDTYFQAGLCVHDMSENLSDDDVRLGTCTETGGWELGNRPRCWYGEEY